MGKKNINKKVVGPGGRYSYGFRLIMARLQPGSSKMEEGLELIWNTWQELEVAHV